MLRWQNFNNSEALAAIEGLKIFFLRKDESSAQVCGKICGNRVLMNLKISLISIPTCKVCTESAPDEPFEMIFGSFGAVSDKVLGSY